MDTGKTVKSYGMNYREALEIAGFDDIAGKMIAFSNAVLSFITLLRSLYMPRRGRKWLRITVQETREPFRTL